MTRPRTSTLIAAAVFVLALLAYVLLRPPAPGVTGSAANYAPAAVAPQHAHPPPLAWPPASQPAHSAPNHPAKPTGDVPPDLHRRPHTPRCRSPVARHIAHDPHLSTQPNRGPNLPATAATHTSDANSRPLNSRCSAGAKGSTDSVLWLVARGPARRCHRPPAIGPWHLRLLHR
jgi:hypothetical protein